MTFGNSAPRKIIAKGMISLSNGKDKAKNVLYVDGLKHNLLGVSQMCDQGYDAIFKAKKCQIKSISTGEIVVVDVRIENNFYVLKEKTKRCYLTKIDEISLWHKRLGYMNFDQIINMRNKNVSKDPQRLSKLENTICKSFQLGKKDRAHFKEKENSTSKPLLNISFSHHRSC